MSALQIPHHSEMVLASGRSIAVTRFGDVDDDAPRELHVCPHCAAESVVAENWVEVSQDFWQMTLVCPDCLWSETDSYNSEEVELFEQELDHRG